MTDEGMFVEAMDNVLKEQRVEGLLRLDWERQIERRTHDVGRGRGSATRAQRVIEHLRYHITHITRQDGPIAALIAGFGWRPLSPMPRQSGCRWPRRSCALATT